MSQHTLEPPLEPLCDHSANRAHLARLRALNPRPPSPARWLYVPYDQLHLDLAPLQEGPSEWGVVLIESGALERQLPFHKQRVGALALNQRAFACEAAARGYAVRYLITERHISEALEGALRGLPEGVAWAREPAERRLRVALSPLVSEGRLRPLPHPGWLTTPEDFERAVGGGAPVAHGHLLSRPAPQDGALDGGGAPGGGEMEL